MALKLQMSSSSGRENCKQYNAAPRGCKISCHGQRPLWSDVLIQSPTFWVKSHPADIRREHADRGIAPLSRRTTSEEDTRTRDMDTESVHVRTNLIKDQGGSIMASRPRNRNSESVRLGSWTDPRPHRPKSSIRAQCRARKSEAYGEVVLYLLKRRASHSPYCPSPPVRLFTLQLQTWSHQ